MRINQERLRRISILILLVTFFAFSYAFAQKAAEESLRKGREYSNKGNYDQAIVNFSIAIKFNPKDAGSYSSRANIYQTKGMYDKAISDFSKAIELNPNNAGIYSERGNA